MVFAFSFSAISVPHRLNAIYLFVSVFTHFLAGPQAPSGARW